MDESVSQTGGETAANVLESGGSGWFACPYCGESQAMGTAECGSCGGLFEALSRQATQNQMGPWQIRDVDSPFMPGRSYMAIRRMAQRGKLTADSVVRGPTTRQFWMAAGEIPGVAHLLGRCHSCKQDVRADSFSCDHCGAVFPNPEDRQSLGLGPVRMLPGQASPAVVAQAATPAVAVRAGDDPPTAFAALARSAAQHATERPSEPVVLAPPAGGAVAAVTPTVDFAGGHEVDVTRSLRVANRRVSALRAVVIALVAVNVVVVIVAAVAIFTGGDPGGAVPAAGDGAEVSE